MTKGSALLEARGLLGPSGHVRFNGSRCEVGLFDERGFVSFGDGYTWNEALSNADAERGRQSAAKQLQEENPFGEDNDQADGEEGRSEKDEVN